MPRLRDAAGRFVATPEWPVEITEPAREPSVTGDVIVPLLQSLIWSMATGVCALVLCWLTELPNWVALLIATIAFVVSWGSALQTAHETIWRTETPLVQRVEPIPQTVRLELTETTPEGNVQRMRIADVPIDDERLKLFVQAALEGRSLSVHRWTPQPLSRSQYERITDALEQAGFITVSRGRGGRRITERGKRVLQKLLEG